MRQRRNKSDTCSKTLARHRCEIWKRFSASKWWICLVFLAAVLSGVGALQVNIPNDIYEFARGDNITLPCNFISKQNNPSLVIITWTVEGIQANAKENLIATHFSHTGRTDIKPAFEKRFSLDVDVPKGKGNLKISSISLAENKVFKCRVLIPGVNEGKLADTARLLVLVAPSKPICKIQGKTEYGQNINLTCVSEEGSPTPTYSWTSHDVINRNHPHAPQTISGEGLLSLFKISKETSGYYVCKSANKIRSASCSVAVSVMPPSINISATAGIIGGLVFLLVLLIINIVCCCRYKRKMEMVREQYAMGVRERQCSDKEPTQNSDNRKAGQGDVREYNDVAPNQRQDQYENRKKWNYNNRQDRYSDRNNRNDHEQRYDDYTDRRYYEYRYPAGRDRTPLPSVKPPTVDYDD